MYISLQATTRVADYFYLFIICKYHYTNKDGGLLDHPYSSQVLQYSEKQGSVRYPIQDFQRYIH